MPVFLVMEMVDVFFIVLCMMIDDLDADLDAIGFIENIKLPLAVDLFVIWAMTPFIT